LVNSKQASLPREACIAVVKLINSRDPQVSELALTLLDYLVKNGGYPVHLQISRKEFLNELVKRFPERPPPAYSRVQRLILGTLAEWVQTLCKTARYKDDLTYIKDMYRLLRSKGYDFPAVKKEDAAVLNPSDGLKSIEELQREERIVQSAKLQELIRRGRPQDLKEANDLMKIMSGFKEDDALEETKQRVYDDLDKLERKITLLDEMLNNATNTGKLDQDDETLQELISAVKVAQPRVQKIIQEEEGTADVAKLLVLNDKINTTLIKIAQIKGEDISNLPTSSVDASKSMNLIDFDDDDVAESSNSNSNSNLGAPNTNDAINDLLGDLGGLSFDKSSSNNGNSQFGVGAINLFGSPEPMSAAPSKPLSNMDILSGFSGSPKPSVSNSGSSSPFPLATATNSSTPSQLDPFGFDFNAPTPSTPSASSATLHFYSDNNITITYTIKSKQPTFEMVLQFSNKSSAQLQNVQMSLAVTKSFDLALKPPTAVVLDAYSTSGISQSATISNKAGQPFNSLKLKFKVSYTNNGVPVEGSGVATITF
jgi:ADP-ribosylation factor-binding protein GGA